MASALVNRFSMVDSDDKIALEFIFEAKAQVTKIIRNRDRAQSCSRYLFPEPSAWAEAESSSYALTVSDHIRKAYGASEALDSTIRLARAYMRSLTEDPDERSAMLEEYLREVDAIHVIGQKACVDMVQDATFRGAAY